MAYGQHPAPQTKLSVRESEGTGDLGNDSFAIIADNFKGHTFPCNGLVPCDLNHRANSRRRKCMQLLFQLYLIFGGGIHQNNPGEFSTQA